MVLYLSIYLSFYFYFLTFEPSTPYCYNPLHLLSVSPPALPAASRHQRPPKPHLSTQPIVLFLCKTSPRPVPVATCYLFRLLSRYCSLDCLVRPCCGQDLIPAHSSVTAARNNSVNTCPDLLLLSNKDHYKRYSLFCCVWILA